MRHATKLERKIDMSKIAIVYWSGTGNTQAMAEAVAEGAKKAGAEAELFTADAFGADQIDGFDAIALGCPAMHSCGSHRLPTAAR